MNKITARILRLKPLDIAVFLISIVLIGYGLWRNFNQDRPICETPAAEHTVKILAEEFEPKSLTLKQCDTIKIVNFDSQNYMLAFGVHDKHIAYPGFSEQLLATNEFIVIDALQMGDFRIHDHLRDKAAIDLHIEPKD